MMIGAAAMKEYSTINAYLWYDYRVNVWRLYDGYETEYDSFELLMERLKGKQQVFVADLKLAQYHMIGKKTNLNYKKGKYYKFRLRDIWWISIDHMWNKPFEVLCKTLNLGEPSGANVKIIVDNINGFSQYKLGTDFITASMFSWKIYCDYCNHPMITYDQYGSKWLFGKYYQTEQLYKLWNDREIYRGGLCLINQRYIGRTVKGLYKYDKNSFYPWVMSTGKMPMGKCTTTKKRPLNIEDAVIHIQWTAKSKFEGLAPYDDKEFICDDMWIWGCELLELMNWYETFDIEYIEYMVWPHNEVDKQMVRYITNAYQGKQSSVGIQRELHKLKMNSIYGKFGENCYKHITKEIDGAIQESIDRGFVIGDKAPTRNVAVSAKITALARAELLRSIRVATNERPDLYYVYGDTDSMILTIPYDNVGKNLGEFKFEGRFQKGRVLGKKCYMLYDGEKYECHACGVNRDVLENEMNAKTWEEASMRFNYDEEFMCPTFVNGTIQKRKRVLSRGYEKHTFDNIYHVYEE